MPIWYLAGGGVGWGVGGGHRRTSWSSYRMTFESFCPRSGIHLCVICPWQQILQLAHELGTSIHARGCSDSSRKPPLERGSCSCNTARGALLRGSSAVIKHSWTPRRRGTSRKPSATAQPRQGRGLTATSMRTTALLSTTWAARLIRAGRAAQSGWRRRMCARHCCV
jgi:hypothetical protein